MFQVNDVHERLTSSAPLGVTQRLAAASSRRPRRTLAIWGLMVLVSLVLVGTSLKGLTTSSHVVGTTQSSQAEALYDEVVGSARPEADRCDRGQLQELDRQRSGLQGLRRPPRGEGRRQPRHHQRRRQPWPGQPTRFAQSTCRPDLLQRGHRRRHQARGPDAVQSANDIGGFSVAVTGDHTVSNDFSTLATSDLRHGELEFGLPIAIVVLLLVFGAVVAGLMPVLMALLSIVVGLGLATLIGEAFHLSNFIVNMMTAMGLALGIDYSLFIISRFREERARGLDKEAAIQRTAATANRAVLFSGTTFVIALFGMFLVPTNVLRSLAAGAVIVGLVSVAAALTLLPAMLHLLGDRVNSLRLPVVGSRPEAANSGESRMWRGFIEGVLRHRLVALTLTIGAAGGVDGARLGTPPRTKRRGHSSRHYPVQGGLRCHSALLPRPGSVPCRNRRPRRIPGDSRGHGKAGGDVGQRSPLWSRHCSDICGWRHRGTHRSDPRRRCLRC